MYYEKFFLCFFVGNVVIYFKNFFYFIKFLKFIKLVLLMCGYGKIFLKYIFWLCLLDNIWFFYNV